MSFKDLIDAEMAEYSDAAYADHGGARDQIERFAEAIAKLEREACARLCEETANTHGWNYDSPSIGREMAHKIRTRSTCDMHRAMQRKPKK